eukprot:4678284-Amphidinium_carterae.1
MGPGILELPGRANVLPCRPSSGATAMERVLFEASQTSAVTGNALWTERTRITTLGGHKRGAKTETPDQRCNAATRIHFDDDFGLDSSWYNLNTKLLPTVLDNVPFRGSGNCIWSSIAGL